MAKTYAVEDCWELSIFALKSDGYMDGFKSGVYSWYRYGRKDGSIGIAVDMERLFVNLKYTEKNYYEEEKDLDYKIHIKESAPHFGGIRYWFKCPLVGCRTEKVAKLYLPPFQTYFGCRKCYGLQYQSSRKSGTWGAKFDKLLDQLDTGDDSAGHEAMAMLNTLKLK